MKEKSVFINTMGCQMNVYDSHQMLNRLSLLGYSPTEELFEADLVIVNTCSIRGKAEQKAFSFLGRLAPLKERNPNLIVAVAGCVAQQEGRAILRRMPYVDLVFGTQAIGRLTKHIQRIAATRCRVVDVQLVDHIGPQEYTLGLYPQSQVASFVTIMRGCDNFCAYCVVPYVRGRETSRPQEDILSEIRHLVDHGTREVTLLGQNVNSYGVKNGVGAFSELLTKVNAIAGLERIRFTTSHPKDLSASLIHAFVTLEKMCNHIHLPVQSGADAILKRMNRRYTRQDYLEKIERLRMTCPDIAISSDIIVGFPGETEADFQETLSLIRQVGYDSLFVFSYSDRPNVPAKRFQGKVEETVKKERLQAILECQEPITQQKNLTLVGTRQQILVDGLSKNQPATNGINPLEKSHTEPQWSGRTTTNKIVHFGQPQTDRLGKQRLTGHLMDIKIEKIMPHCLWGYPMIPSSTSSGKGDRCHVA